MGGEVAFGEAEGLLEERERCGAAVAEHVQDGHAGGVVDDFVETFG